MFEIGDFSRLARVTTRTLHHYDVAGLLHPAHTSRQSGHRYYGASQLVTLQRISLLKDLEFPLEDIRYLLSVNLSNRDFLRLLDARRQQLAESITADESRLRRLDALRQSARGAASVGVPVVRLTTTPSIEVHTRRARVPRLGRPVQALFDAAEASVARARARADASPLLLFHDDEYRDEAVDVEVCIPLKRSTESLSSRTLPAFEAVGCVTYQGASDRTPELYAAMLQWMARSGLRIAGPLREIYHRCGVDRSGCRLPCSVTGESPADCVTELQVPVAPNDDNCAAEALLASSAAE